MNDYQPKVGDRVMVGEHGPFGVAQVECYDGQRRCHVRDTSEIDYCVPIDWLTPAPEPEPDEPTAPGALVRDGDGYLWCRSSVPRSFPWIAVGPSPDGAWRHIPRPIAVVLADPAEVETLRSQRDTLFAQRDELQRRIDRALDVLSAPWEGDSAADRLDHADDVLRGGS